jgi:cyclin-dependent kinase-like
MDLDATWLKAKEEYKLLSFIGKGSYGVVVKAKHRVTKQVVAIKQIKFHPYDIHNLRSVTREILILKQLTAMK